MPDSGQPQPSSYQLGNYTAHVLHHTSVESFWYYIIERMGSNAVIDLVKCASYEQAMVLSQQVLERLMGGEGQAAYNRGSWRS
ncbi:MAG TPA: hypothetical protein VNX88_17410 [Terriglobales bacterium]|nr:hypothetical protein [Terriglobales bacterium]